VFVIVQATFCVIIYFQIPNKIASFFCKVISFYLGRGGIFWLRCKSRTDVVMVSALELAQFAREGCSRREAYRKLGILCVQSPVLRE
jgi:hypothetical protein